ncbi:MAG: hypothetical protein KJ072_10125 [Verrucomicrobia bacterium]|nr:hypothetical protein [Verrucomicrobiota bacterium]
MLATALVPLLAVLPATGQTNTPFTATSWLTGVPVPGLLCTNALGQVYLKGNVHVLMVQADDARVAGRLQAMPDVAFQADGTRAFSGAAYDEVGTWDATGANFTPGGGVWDLKYRGVTQADGSVQYSMAGYGIGGTIDGLRIELTATREAGPMFDPTIPYLASGTIESAPVSSSLVIDDFEDGVPTGWDKGGGSRMPVLSETGGHFTVGCDWTGVPTANPLATLAWAGHDQAWTVPDGYTVELRADLMALNQASDSAVLAFAVQSGGPNYLLMKGHSWLILLKQNGAAMAALCGDNVATPDTGVVMSLALTDEGQNLLLTARVFDKTDPTKPLYEFDYLDTPASDEVLSSQGIADLVGASLSGFGPDPGAAWKTGQRVWLGVWQNTDGTKPAAEATFDNLELHTYEIPQVGIARTIQLTWPITGMNYAVEGGPTVQGPWLPINEVATPGLKQMTVPANDIMKVFRLRQAP